MTLPRFAQYFIAYQGNSQQRYYDTRPDKKGVY
jgi:hypothetical protein